MFPWILGVGTRSLIQEAPNVWLDHFENIFQPVLIPHCQKHNGVECFEQNNSTNCDQSGCTKVDDAVCIFAKSSLAIKRAVNDYTII